MIKRIVAVDFDDVVAGFNLAFATFHNDKFGTSVEYDDITTYVMTDVYKTDMETLLGRIHMFCHGHHHEIKPIYDAYLEFLILNEYFDLQIITSRCESLSKITEAWLSVHMPEIFTYIHFTNGFGTKHPDRKRLKSDVCKEIGAVAMIDDALMHTEEVAAECSIPVLMPNRPWNQGDIHPDIIRKETLCEIVEWLTTKLPRAT
ncbi:MAG: hypothetical protein LR008_03850 [Candidatus Pacebacteria bacterium]|nr:hypothetical protein [Candidatus Paceibacterota bacterium]